MSYTLQSVTKGSNRGRTKGVGSLIRLPNGSLGTFVGYCPSDDCYSKICMGFEDARRFSSKYNRERRKLFNRILLSMLQRLEAKTR